MPMTKSSALKQGFGVVMVVLIAVILAGCIRKKTVPASTIPEPTGVEESNVNSANTSQPKVYTMKQVLGSGQEGTVTLSDVNGKASVVIAVTAGPTGVEQPAHIHNGSCVTLGGIVYGLNNVVDGKSETTLDVPLAEIFNSLPLAVNIHKSREEVSVYTACIEIGSEEMSNIKKSGESSTTEDGAEKDDNTADDDENKNSNVNVNINANLNVNVNANVSTNTSDDKEGEIKTFTITGRNFSFSQAELRVKKGDTVRINFTTVEGFHDWVLDEFSAATKQVSAGNSSSVEFVASKSGTFEYYCSVGSHRQMGMVGKLIVE